MRLRSVVTLASFVLGAGAFAQMVEGPPEQMPPAARLPAVDMRFGVASLSLPVTSGVGGVLTVLGQSTSQLRAATSLDRGDGTSDAPPPEVVPAGAQFPSAAATFADTSLSLPSTSAGLIEAAASIPSLELKQEGRGLRFTLNADVLFDFDKWNLRKEAGPVLEKLIEEVRARMPEGARFSVEGHTDWMGSDSYNDRLSNRRAQSVKAWLVKNAAMPGHHVLTMGFGERRPVAPNAKPDGSDDPEGRQKNRRVEILVTPTR